jgi:nucleoside 2-deoxyribosyltransferase
MLKIYLAAPMFEEPDIVYNLQLSTILRKNGYLVYCPNENMSINDKSKSDITPEKFIKLISTNY